MSVLRISLSLQTPLPDRPLCRHCKRRLAARGKRGLCFADHCDPAIRALYPSESKFSSRWTWHGIPDTERVPPPPDRPTSATPGTEAKLLVLTERARRGRSLWHPYDARVDDEGRRRLARRLPELAAPVGP